MTHACDDEDSKIHTVRSTVTEREAREGFSRDLAGEVERAQPSSTFERKERPPSKLDMPRWIVLYKSRKAEPWNL